jgi:hypothetical protein
MKISSNDKVYVAVIQRSCELGGVSSQPAEVGLTAPRLPVGRSKPVEHPVVPGTTLGTHTIVPFIPVNGSNLLTTAPL